MNGALKASRCRLAYAKQADMVDVGCLTVMSTTAVVNLGRGGKK